MTGRLLAALVANALLAGLGLRAGAIDRSGALAGAALGVAIYAGLDWPGYGLLALFVALGSGFTRVGVARKAVLGVAQERRGARSWRNALANCGVAAGCAAVAGVTGLPWWRVAFAGSLAAALADTTESELGSLAGRTAYLLPCFARVPPGTEGAVSLAGSLLGLAASTGLAAVALAGGLVTGPAAVGVAVGGWLATLVESGLAGGRELNNELLNTVTTLSGAGLAVGLGWLGS